MSNEPGREASTSTVDETCREAADGECNWRDCPAEDTDPCPLKVGREATLPSQADMLAWVAARWPDHVSPVWRAVKVGEEAGEVLGAVVKESIGLKPKSAIEVEAAQVVLCVMALAESCGFDLWAAVAAEWHDLASRTWPSPSARETSR